MSNFDEALKSAFAVNLSEGEAFTEELIYTKCVGGATRTFYGVINRDPPTEVGGDGRVTRPKMLALVQNDATNGIASDELDTKDTLTVAYRIGTTAKQYLIRLADRPGNQNAATLTLELD